MPTLDQDALLAVVDNVIDDGYLQPIKDAGPGYELYQAAAAVGERCSASIDNFERDVYILTSRGGQLTTVQAVFYRASAAAGAGSVLAGTIVRASRGGQIFRVRDSVAFGPADLEVTTTAVAVGYGYEWNIKGVFVDPQGASWPGELDTIDLPLQNPVFFDPSIKVRNDDDSDGLGRPATLDVLGSERKLGRQPSETDTNYRARIRVLPDTVTPAAIARQLANYFRRFPSMSYRTIETWRHEYQEVFDAPDIPADQEPYDANLFCFDDPRPSSPMQNRWLGEIDHLGAFIVEIEEPDSITEFSMLFDDPAGDSVGVPPTAGIRALSAFDLPDTFAAPIMSPSFDGVDFGQDRFLLDLSAILDDVKAAGVYGVIAIAE